MLGSRGEIIPLPLSALRDSPFETYFGPGLILFCALGLGPLAAALLAWRRHPLAPIATLVSNEIVALSRREEAQRRSDQGADLIEGTRTRRS